MKLFQKSRKTPKAKIKQKSAINKKVIIPFILIFAGIGAYLLYKSFAATPILKGNDGEYVAITPSRMLDTQLGQGATYKLKVVGKNGVPASNVSAVVVNLTAASPTQTSYITAYPSGTSLPNASSLNFNAGISAIANQIVVKVGTDGSIDLFNSLGSVRAIVDVNGYFSTETGVNGSRLTVLNPTRIYETTLAPGADNVIQIAGVNGVPLNGATAVSVNITAADSSGDGFISVYPSGESRPGTSTLNYTARNYATANHIITKMGTDGKIRLYNEGASARVILDLSGFFGTEFAGSSLTQAGRFVPMNPTRLIDVQQSPGATSIHYMPQAVRSENISAVVLNITAASPSSNGYVSAYPSGQPRPFVSSLNYTNGTVATANQLIVPVGPDGAVYFYNDSGNTRIIVDISGYFIKSEEIKTPVTMIVSPSNVFNLKNKTFDMTISSLPGTEPLKINIVDLPQIDISMNATTAANQVSISCYNNDTQDCQFSNLPGIRFLAYTNFKKADFSYPLTSGKYTFEYVSYDSLPGFTGKRVVLSVVNPQGVKTQLLNASQSFIVASNTINFTNSKFSCSNPQYSKITIGNPIIDGKPVGVSSVNSAQTNLLRNNTCPGYVKTIYLATNSTWQFESGIATANRDSVKPTLTATWDSVNNVINLNVKDSGRVVYYDASSGQQNITSFANNLLNNSSSFSIPVNTSTGFKLGKQTISLSATDDSGNFGTISINVNVTK